MLKPEDIVIDGWDISSLNIAAAAERAHVLDYNLQQELYSLMEPLKPRPAIFNQQFVAANQVQVVNIFTLLRLHLFKTEKIN